MNFSKQEILNLLTLEFSEFEKTVMQPARELYRKGENRLYASAMLGFDNICKNQCLYCGMRAGSKGVERYRMTPQEVLAAVSQAVAMGVDRIFLISGEDPSYGFDALLKITEGVKGMGLHLSLACGELDLSQYGELKAAGADEYVLKFEMSDPDTFDRLNPSTNFRRRMKGIEAIRESGMKLASGNIVGFPGQSLEQLANDILLMKKLEISWAPIIPYLPAVGTPLALEGGPGDILLNLREISILRLMMPDILITAQQPGHDLRQGLGGEEGNLMALNAGANILFADLLPDSRVRSFRVIDDRVVLRLDHIRRMAQLAGMDLSLGGK